MDTHLDAREGEIVKLELAQLDVRQPAETDLGEQAARLQRAVDLNARVEDRGAVLKLADRDLQRLSRVAQPPEDGVGAVIETDHGPGPPLFPRCSCHPRSAGTHRRGGRGSR